MSDEFQNADNPEMFTDADKDSAAYTACVAGVTLVSSGVGALTRTVPGIVLGGVLGYLIGSKACKSPRIKEGIRQKFSSNERLSLEEFVQLYQSVHREFPHLKKREALDAIASARIGVAALANV